MSGHFLIHIADKSRDEWKGEEGRRGRKKEQTMTEEGSGKDLGESWDKAKNWNRGTVKKVWGNKEKE